MATTFKISKKNLLVLKEMIKRGYFRDKHELINHILFTYFESKEFYAIFKQEKIDTKEYLKGKEK